MADVTDATFESDVLARSREVPVVVDLWAPWCGPCKQLTPTLEKVVGATGGQVVLAKVNIDENPAVAQAFQVQSIPAVFALKDGQVVDSFLGAVPETTVQAMVDKLLPVVEKTEAQRLIELGDEASLEAALALEPDNHDAVVALAELRIADGRTEDALALLERVPESADTRRVAALARIGVDGALSDGDISARLDGLLDQVKGDDAARQQFVDLLELLGPDDPRTASYRRQLTARLF
ncbi:MAG: thioredoxin [Acidimicrobiales bacterium]